MDGESIKPNPNETNISGHGEPVTLLPIDADQVLNRTGVALKEKRASLASGSQSSIDSVLDVCSCI